MSDRSLDKISLNRFTVYCMMGFAKHERVSPQPIEVDLDLYFDASKAAKSGAIEHAVDYVKVLGEVRLLLESARFVLIETAAETICRYLLGISKFDVDRPAMDRVSIRLTKPNALSGVAIPSLSISRSSVQYQPSIQEFSYGLMDSCCEMPEAVVSWMRLKPGAKVILNGQPNSDEVDMILGKDITCQGQRVKEGAAFFWPKGTDRWYENQADSPRSLLFVSREGQPKLPKSQPFNDPPHAWHSQTAVAFYPGVVDAYLNA